MLKAFRWFRIRTCGQGSSREPPTGTIELRRCVAGYVSHHALLIASGGTKRSLFASYAVSLLSGLKSLRINCFRLPFKLPSFQFGCLSLAVGRNGLSLLHMQFH